MEIKTLKKDEIIAMALYCVADKKSKFVYNNLNIRDIGVKLLDELSKPECEGDQLSDTDKQQLQQPDVVGRSEQLKCFISEEFAQCHNPKKNSECISCKHY